MVKMSFGSSFFHRRSNYYGISNDVLTVENLVIISILTQTHSHILNIIAYEDLKLRIEGPNYLV
jgi:hypothetical protein